MRVLYEWLTIKIPKSRGESVPAVALIFQGAWEGGNNDLWRQLEGFDRRKTALSDHLHDLFKEWSRDFLFTDKEFTHWFEWLELLASLAFMTIETSLENLAEAEKRQTGQNPVWFPTGRIAWDSEARDVILSQMNEDVNRRSLLDAGFAGGSEQFFNLALNNARRLFGRFQWM